MSNEPEINDNAALKAALIAAKEDPMACHSIAVWEQIDDAIAAATDGERR